MHDTFLLNKISEALGELCRKNRIVRIARMRIIVNHGSHIHRDSLYERLLKDHDGVVGDWTELVISREDIENQTAIIESIEGDLIEQ